MARMAIKASLTVSFALSTVEPRYNDTSYNDILGSNDTKPGPVEFCSIVTIIYNDTYSYFISLILGSPERIVIFSLNTQANLHEL